MGQTNSLFTSYFLLFTLPMFATLHAFLFGLAAVCLLEGWRTRRWGWLVVAGGILASQLVSLSPSQLTAVSHQPPAVSQPSAPNPQSTIQNPQSFTLLPFPPLSISANPTISSAPPPLRPSAEPSPTPPPPLLQIPRLGLETAVQTIPIVGGMWDVSALGAGVGLLEGLADEPVVLVGHMTFPWLNLLQEGAFAHLQDVRLGDEVVYTLGGEMVRYEVAAVGRLAPDAVAELLTAAPNTLLLLTCTDWNFETWQYDNRLVVTAVRVE